MVLNHDSRRTIAASDLTAPRANFISEIKNKKGWAEVV